LATTAALTILGSSSARPDPDLGTSAYLLDVDGDLSLIDAGAGGMSAFMRLGFDATRLRRVFISHPHADHVCELPLVVQTIHLTCRTEPLELYLPEEFVEPFRATLRSMYLFEERFAFPLVVTGMSNGYHYAGDFNLTAIGNAHMDKLAPFVAEHRLPNRLQSFSFLIEIAGQRLLYSGDLGSFADIQPYLEDCDIILTELTHVDPDEFFAAARSLPARRIIAIHLADAAEAASVLARAEAAGLTNLEIAREGLRLNLTG
jgi:ribonuclease BN (tRNA processing enzyme)